MFTAWESLSVNYRGCKSKIYGVIKKGQARIACALVRINTHPRTKCKWKFTSLNNVQWTCIHFIIITTTIIIVIIDAVIVIFKQKPQIIDLSNYQKYFWQTIQNICKKICLQQVGIQLQCGLDVLSL